MIVLANEDGSMETSPHRIADRACNYFAQLFTASEYCMHEELFYQYPKGISADINEELASVPGEEEIRDAIRQLSPDSAPGLDGFSGHFYSSCWHQIKAEVIAMVQGFFMGDQMDSEVATTTLVLLPKVTNPRQLSDFRPISLGNFSSKLISKILASRFAKYLHLVIDEEQAGFVRGRSIHENIALTQELVEDIDRKTEGGNLIFKFDMSKAYDRLEWRFILRAMRAMGFSEKVRDLIYRTISNIRYTFLINGEAVGKFKSSRGVRQGDPLSPLIYILAQQVFSYNLKKWVAQGDIKAYHTGRGGINITHLFYADDMLLFTNGSKRSLQKLLKLITMYTQSSGQEVNFAKSGVYVPTKMAVSRVQQISVWTECVCKRLPLMYLGAPISKGKGRVQLFDYLIQKIANKLEGWKTKFLSFAGRITLLKSVLCSIPIHTLSSVDTPKSVIMRIERLMKSFLWASRGQKRSNWVAWDKVCLPLAEGGLGIRSLVDTMELCRGKLAWQIIQRRSLWARYMYRKMFRTSDHANPPPGLSRMGQRLWPHVQRLRAHSRWIIGQGHISLWNENWGGDIISPPSTAPDLTVAAARSHIDDIQHYMSTEQVEKLIHIQIFPEIEDTLVFTLDKSGKFSNAIYWELIRHKRPEVAWADIIWNKHTPFRVNTFMWRWHQKALSTDDNVKKKGIPLVSKCVCCTHCKEESTQHLFFTSDCAQQVWNYFARVLHMPYCNVSGISLYNKWMHGVSWRSQLGTCITSIFFFGLFEIWKGRCKAVFEDANMSSQGIINKVLYHVYSTCLANPPKRPPTAWDRVILETLKLPVFTPKLQRGKWVWWQKPTIGSFKINVDGVSSTHGTTSGKVIRDHAGEFVVGFTRYYDRNSSLWAELQAILDGISIGQDMGLTNMVIESDSELAVKMINGVIDMQWETALLVRVGRQRLQGGGTVVHCLREANNAADAIAKIRDNNGHNKLFTSLSAVPTGAQKFLWQDRIGVPTFRRKP